MAFESVHNYYENLVFIEIRKVLKKRKINADDDDYPEDIACVALNRLPTRYVRHHVDLAFYLTIEERVLGQHPAHAVVASVAAVVAINDLFLESRCRRVGLEDDRRAQHAGVDYPRVEGAAAQQDCSEGEN